jgi:hypothetical protein
LQALSSTKPVRVERRIFFIKEVNKVKSKNEVSVKSEAKLLVDSALQRYKVWVLNWIIQCKARRNGPLAVAVLQLRQSERAVSTKKRRL